MLVGPGEPRGSSTSSSTVKRTVVFMIPPAVTMPASTINEGLGPCALLMAPTRTDTAIPPSAYQNSDHA